jgi:hypothetical protein
MPRAETVISNDRFHQPPHVASVRVADATVLLDRKRGTYFTLNEVGGRVWELLGSGRTVSEMVERLLEEYEVTREQLEADVTTTLRNLTDDLLLASGTASDSMPAQRPPGPPARAVINSGPAKVPSVLWCGLLIAWFKGLLRIRRIQGTLDWIRQRTESLPAAAETGLETVRAFEYAVAMAAALYPGRAKCLEQSLTLYYLLRRQGVNVKFIMGVQVYPFGAHAWVEYRGEPVTDVAEHVSWFVPLPGALS